MIARAWAAVAALLAATAAVPALPAAPARAAGLPGACPDAGGVTVVVDFQQLGGQTIVRCAPGPQSSGLAALKSAGITVTGTARWGEAFICRIEGKPSADTESCIDTPPATAYWSYWHARGGGPWTYSQQGVTARTPPPGSFEGWSFALDSTASGAPPPRVAPRRPASSPPPGEQQPPDPPSADEGGDAGPGDAAAPGAPGDRPAGGDTGQPPADPETGSAPAPSTTPAAPTAAPATTGVTGPASPPPPTSPGEGVAASRSSSGAPAGTLVGLGLLLALLVAGAVTAWRRRRASRA